MVLTGERTLSDTLGATQYCPRARQTAADNYVYRLSSALKIDYCAHTNAQTETKNYVTPQVCQLLRNISLLMRHQTTSFPMQLHDGTTVPQ
jgi:hypothetical protein